MPFSTSALIRATAMALVITGAAVALPGCAVSVPPGVQPVSNFDASKYMGTWYELARLDHRFEKGLTQVTATYSLNSDGSVTVLNRGYDAAKQKWREAEGKAHFLGQADKAALKVSFFGPFYGGYNVVSLDDQYHTALVIGSSPDYMWILSRSKTIPETQRQALLEKAQTLGIDLAQVIRVEQ
ncbi:lipocalin family protein [Comamonas koreensis]|uniref:Outer membrane lipoprotein Blc n=1 Tax=Comamonas koreensis TaxID=160825 RepID=A0AAW4Y2F2_9BURK|nr:lipocalin family protein [Comamonas koreensis]MCD2167831.1 lipocalin family protein [Comamonas koreensis]